MAFVLKDRVRETTSTSGTGAIVVSGVVSGGYRTFNATLSNGDTTLCLVRNNAGQWQTFLGTWSSATQSMARTTVYDGSSGAGVLVNFSGEQQEIWINYPAQHYENPWFERVYIGASPFAMTAPAQFRMQSAEAVTDSGSNFRVSANLFGSLTASKEGHWIFAADTDNITFSNTNNGLTLNYRGQAMTSGWSGGRTTDLSFLNITASGTAGSSAYHVSGGSEIRANASMGGAPGATRGNVFSRNEIARVQSGAGPHVISVFGEEFDISVEGDARVLWKGGAKVVYLTGDTTRGIQQDYAFSVGLQASGTSPGAGICYAIGGVEGWWPLTETSYVMEGITEGGIVNGPAPAIAGGVDFSNLTRIRESAFKSIGYKVDGSGNLGALVASGERLQTRGEIVAKTAVVASIEVVDGGVYGGTISIAVGASPGGGTNATASVSAWGFVAGNSIGSNGTGYAVGDTFDVSGGTFTAAAVFTGTIADNVLTVSSVTSGTITNNSIVIGAIAGTKIIAFGTGAGGVGTYIVDTSQVLSTPTSFTAAGAATGVVTNVSGGQVTGFRIVNPGQYTVLPSAPVSTTATTGAGTGFTFTPTYMILGVTLTNAGTLYSEFLPPRVTASGSIGTFRGATFKVTMTGTQTALSLNPGGGLNVTASALGNYANDAAAAAGGVPVNGIYRNGSVIMVRVV